MLKALLKKQLGEIFKNYFYNPKTNKARSKAGTALYFALFAALMIFLMGGLFTLLSISLCSPLESVGFGWLYFAIMGLISILLGTFGSVFNTYSGLYLAKDNDLLFSLPIPVNTIFSARLLNVYIMGLMYSGIVSLPAIIVYLCVVPFKISTLICSLIFVFLISLFVLTLSCILGFAVAKISQKLKNKSFITVIIALLFIGIYYLFYFKAQTLISEIIKNAAVYGAKIKNSAYPIYIFGKSATGDPAATALLFIVIAASLFVVLAVISHSFLKTATSVSAAPNIRRKALSLKSKSPGSAMLGKEFMRFISSPNYMLNCGFGILFLIMFPIIDFAMNRNGDSIVKIFGEMLLSRSGFIYILIPSIVCMVASANNMAAASVSLEGKSLWIVKSLPVTPVRILYSKLSVQLILTAVPAFLCALYFNIAYCENALQYLLIFSIILTYVLLSALFDLFLSLKFVNLNWTSELVPIKQSASSMFSLLAGFIYPVLLSAIYLLIGYKIGFYAYMLLFLSANILLSLALIKWIKSKGTEIFCDL